MELINVLTGVGQAAHGIIEHETSELLRSVNSIHTSLHHNNQSLDESSASSLNHPLNPMNERNRSSIGHVSNLDHFFKNMYQYYISKGLPAIILSQLCSIASLSFTISFTIFLLAFIDWDAVLKCHDETTCDDLKHYFVQNPFQQSTFYTFLVVMYFIIFGSLWLWRCVSAMHIITESVEMEKVGRLVGRKENR